MSAYIDSPNKIYRCGKSPASIAQEYSNLLLFIDSNAILWSQKTSCNVAYLCNCVRIAYALSLRAERRNHFLSSCNSNDEDILLAAVATKLTLLEYQSSHSFARVGCKVGALFFFFISLLPSLSVLLEK